MKIHSLQTEQNNSATARISYCSTMEMIRLINQEDQKVALAVEKEIPNIAKAVDAAANRLKQGGKMFYFGAGTSGRLGVIDASEVLCTFGFQNIHAIIAGGKDAIFDAAMGAEDDGLAAVEEIKKHSVGALDVVVGIAASGRTPYPLAAMKAAKKSGALAIGICNNVASEMEKIADICISPQTGPEVIEGSTRMKAGTSQKMVLNMLSTGIMIRLGRVYQNRMVYMTPNNEKLYARALRIVMDSTGAEEKTALDTLKACDYHISTALVMFRFACSQKQAEELLASYNGNISEMEKRDELYHRD